MATTAAATVFGITELLEQILLYTDPRTLLLAQRVNKFFRATTQSRNELQTRLYLRQSSEATLKYISLDEELNILLPKRDRYGLID
ncbi:hypothetical protein LTR95_005805 [Oleoguttula sp. CCFEE 5521]